MRRAWMAVSLLHLCACRYAPTQVVIEVDTNVSRTREASLTIVGSNGDAPVERLRALDGRVLRSSAERPLFPGSFAVVPRDGGPRSGLVTVLATLEVAASDGQPALRIERLIRVHHFERSPQLARMYFNARCADRAQGCVTAAPEACTVSRRCVEQGATCGDEGECVAVELPQAPAEEDAQAPALDSSAPAPVDSGRVLDETTVTAPRPIAPLSTATVTSQQPTLRWQLSPETDGARLELCRDRAMSTGCLAPVMVAGDRARPSVNLVSGWWYWRVRGRSGAILGLSTSPVWQLRVGARSAATDTSAGTEADFNGDGFADLVVGAGSASPGRRANAGIARVYMGSASGPSAVAARVLEGPTAGERFGETVASAGDLNGDGFADLVVGSRLASPPGKPMAGSVSVYFGGPNGVGPAPVRVLQGAAARDRFSYALSSAGDVNGDGYADLAVGAFLSGAGGRAEEGSVSVFHGGPSGVSAPAARVYTGAGPGDRLGNSVAGALDVNADGFSDLAVGSLFADPSGRADAGRVSLFLGGPSGLSPTVSASIEGLAAGDQLGHSLANVGDTNGDGYSDLAVGARFAAPGGRMSAGTASVFLGSSSGLMSAPSRVIEGWVVNEQLGTALAGCGDVNGDGYADVAVSSTLADPDGRVDAGSVAVFHGGPSGIGTTAARVLDGLVAGEQFGDGLAGCGDLDGDGYADVAVGASLADPAGRINAGAASVFLGGAGGVVPMASRVFEGAASEDRTGGALASALRCLRLRPGAG